VRYSVLSLPCNSGQRRCRVSVFTVHPPYGEKDQGSCGQQGAGGTCTAVSANLNGKKIKWSFWCIKFPPCFLLMSVELTGFLLKWTLGFPTSQKQRISLAESPADTAPSGGRKGQERSSWWGHQRGWRSVSGDA